ncbi:MAG TPA: hypothetical protein DGG94_15390 [Micromonosporaceae bacterium]|nr:hypothetical protein [Micromonosporaceae bacterium]
MRMELRSFVQRRAGDLPVTDQTGLFTQRVLRSLHLPELIILLERLRGAPIDVERLHHGDLDSIDTIIERFGAAS